jgi:hypothetical protein
MKIINVQSSFFGGGANDFARQKFYSNNERGREQNDFSQAYQNLSHSRRVHNLRISWREF